MTSFHARFSLGVLVGSVLLHSALAARLGAPTALLFAAPSLVLAGTSWVTRTRWVLWVGLGVLVLLEACALAGFLSADEDTAGVIVSAFAIALSIVQVPISALAATVRYFQSAE